AERRLAAPDESTSDLGGRAGEAALRSAGIPAPGAVLLATSTPDQLCPATAPAVAARLGAASVFALDLAAACSGFVYALAVAASLVRTGLADDVLVIGADKYSTLVDPHCPTTGMLFGDGAGAVVVHAAEPGAPGALEHFDLHSDGAQAHLVGVEAGGARRRDPGEDPRSRYLTMSGREIYRHAVSAMTDSTLTVTDRAGWTLSEIDRLVPHQANARIISAVGKRLGLPEDRSVLNIGEVGNTVAASVPLALAHAVRTNQLVGGERIVVTAFGAGLTWGSAALVWPKLTLA
ncbi:beta-ketoacyl-ACP synthase 3, partial [Crossiella equi]|uniref:beta-ketoacyl-ACP synthase 3 n=1 Tax=Crossiella equi TaxID=130796 RepID=UPI000A394337